MWRSFPLRLKVANTCDTARWGMIKTEGAMLSVFTYQQPGGIPLIWLRQVKVGLISVAKVRRTRINHFIRERRAL